MRLNPTAWFRGRVALSLVLLAGCSVSPVSTDLPRVDTVFVNGNILTMESAQPEARVLVVKDGRIVAVGGDALARQYRARKVIDLAGRTLLPGFNDTHIHIDDNARRYIDLSEVASIKELQSLVRNKARELGTGEWVTGYGWSEDALSEARKPNRSDLDAVAPNNPVVLTRAGAHSAVANSLALSLAGFSADSPDPQNGGLERTLDGELSGIIRERQDILLALVPPARETELAASLSANLQALFAHGITSITQATATPAEIERWRTLYARKPGKHPRAAVQLVWPGLQNFRKFQGRSGEGDEYFRLGALKVFVDGGFTGPAAYTKQPYRGETSYRGRLALTERELREIITTAHAAEWQLGIHAIGDAAIELVVEELARAVQALPRADHRHYLNHFTVMPSADTMRTMANLGVWVTQQPNFTYTLEGRYVDYLDGVRLETNNPLRTPLTHGVFMALSSDILPIGPMLGIYAAVTRRGMSGRQFGPTEALTVAEALKGYTRNAAYFTREEAIKGTLAPGKLADLVVLERNPLTTDPEGIKDIAVEQTWLGGQQVFARSGSL